MAYRNYNPWYDLPPSEEPNSMSIDTLSCKGHCKWIELKMEVGGVQPKRIQPTCRTNNIYQERMSSLCWSFIAETDADVRVHKNSVIARQYESQCDSKTNDMNRFEKIHCVNSGFGPCPVFWECEVVKIYVIIVRMDERMYARTDLNRKNAME